MSDQQAEPRPSRPLRGRFPEVANRWMVLLISLTTLGSMLGGGAVYAIGYFATRDALDTTRLELERTLDRTDCAQYWSVELLKAQVEQQIYKDVYEYWNTEAARAQVEHQKEPDDVTKLIAFRDATDRQNKAEATMTEADAAAGAARKEIKRCAHPGRDGS